MVLQTLLVAIVAGLLSTATALPYQRYNASAYCVPHKISPWEQKKIWEAFVDDFYVKGNVSDTFHRYVTEDYIQHNPFEGQGAAASVAYLTPIFEDSSIKVTILRTSFENDLGWIHTKIIGFAARPTAIVDVFRFNGSCVQEHWDVIETLPENATNPIALF